MNIIIPMGGLGERFKNEGYINPKPLINIHGKPMLEHVINSLSLNYNDTLILIYNKELDNYNFKSIIKKENIRYHVLNHQTKGAAETILSLLREEHIDKLRKTVVCDCDTFYSQDILANFRGMNNNAIMYFEDYTEAPIYSYIKVNDIGTVSEIKEKVKISHFANTGCYCFESLTILLDYCSKVVASNYKFNNEFYVSCVIDMMLKDGHIFHPIKIQQKDIHCVGTPNQLKLYSLTANNKGGIKPLRFCFDIDHTLFSMDANYKSGIVIEKNVNFLKYLKKQGHTIILYTARRMKTHSSNVGKVLKDIGKLTLDYLAEHDVPYDEIYFGKPYADFYIDDKAINAYCDLEKETGIYQNSIQERATNNIEYAVMPIIIKKGEPWKIAGEVYYYNHIPDAIKGYFPVFIRADKDNYILEKVDGINVSFLFVKQQMSMDIFKKMLASLNRIHEYRPQDDGSLKQKVYMHYRRRLAKRSEHPIYETLPNAKKIYALLDRFFTYYEANDLARIAMIHGDPVFSNILITKEGTIKFIDMRGVLLDDVTVYGDTLYDLAKIFQCLIGYDEHMHDTYANNQYKSNLLAELERAFSSVNFEWVKIIAYSHLYTLVPLHEYTKAIKYYELIDVNALESLVCSVPPSLKL